MLGYSLYLNNSHIFIQFLFSLSSQGEACKEELLPAKLSAVLACTELTPCSVSQLWISTFFSKNQHMGPSFSQIFIFFKVCIRAVSAWAELNPRSVSLCGITYFPNISAKTNFKKNHFNLLYQGPRWVRFMTKNAKNLVTLPL